MTRISDDNILIGEKKYYHQELHCVFCNEVLWMFCFILN